LNDSDVEIFSRRPPAVSDVRWPALWWSEAQ